MSFTIGSLFDGSGGFPLAAFLAGGVPVWASEVEPYPIAVTRSRFPYMKHLGDISKINGAEVEPVDVISFGSPCQDLSVAGLRKGLKHEDNGDDETTRSGLFMEAVRIIKEMREATNGEHPKFALWENVPGAFSSNKGEDFRIVLEELIKIIEPSAVMPAVPKNGWAYADSYIGDGWSLAYRVFDAQFLRTAQRRRRIYLVLDLTGGRAREILFERESLRGYFTEGGTPWQGIAGDVEGGVGAADCESNGVAYSFDSLSSNSMKSSNPHSGCRQTEIAKTIDTSNPDPSKNQGGIAIVQEVPYLLKIRSGCEGGGKGALIQEDKSATLSTLNDQYLFQPVSASESDVAATLYAAYGTKWNGNAGAYNGENFVLQPITLEPGIAAREGGHIYEGVSGTLRANAGVNQMAVAYVIDSIGGQAEMAKEGDVAPCLKASHYKFAPTIVGCLASSAVNAETTDGEISPCLMARAGTGGNQLPLVALAFDARGNGDGSVVPTITGGHNNSVTDYTTIVCCIDGDKIGKSERTGGSGLGIRDGDKMYTLTAKDAGTHSVCIPINDKATRYNGGGETRNNDGSGNGLGVGETGDPSPTLTAGDRHAVAYAMQGFGDYKESDVASGLKARDYKDATDLVTEPIAIDRAFFNQGQNALYDPQLYEDGTNPTLVARGPNAVAVRYIVRRLTPTECARLQGFPDRWGHPDSKETFTADELTFWQDVRNTHAEINGKATKKYTEAQMLTWYNKLHTDSSEHKMWGNGIALPCAVYVMQGIAEVFK